MSALSFTLKQDDLTPMIKRAQQVGRNPTPILRAMGTTFMSITMGNFHGGTSFRPAPWKAKMDGTQSNLQQTGNLSRSFHLAVTAQTARVGTPVIYAGIHQMGGIIAAKNGKALRFRDSTGNWHTVKSVKMPARPFFPVDGSGQNLTPPANQLVKRAGQRALDRILKNA
jgi:phage gpG-like protein